MKVVDGDRGIVRDGDGPPLSPLLVPVEDERCNDQAEPFPSANSAGTTDEPSRWWDRLFHAVNGLYDGWYEGY